MAGERISILVDNKTKYYDFQVKLTENRKETQDGSCMNYPSLEHQSYTTCIDEELRGFVVPTLGCMIPWMSELEQCAGNVTRLTNNHQIEKWLSDVIQESWRGFQYKSTRCPLPCNLITGKASYLLSGEYEHNIFGLYLEDEVKVERIMLAYGFTDLLVEIGSCLGLWLGLSVVGIFDIVVTIVANVQHSLYWYFKKSSDQKKTKK